MRILAIFAIAVLLFSSLALAENNTSLAEIFPSNDTTFLPPSVDELGSPEAEETPQKSANGMFAIEAGAADSAGDIKNLNLEIRDIKSGDLITDAHIRVYMSNNGQQVGTLRFVGEDGTISLQLPADTWQITLKLDIIGTPGKDYYSQFQVILNSDQNQTAFMQAVGSLSGDVVDENNKLIQDAEVKFECSGDYGETALLATDQFGSFSAEWLPVGSCKVSAISGKKVSSSTVQISQGEVSVVSIVLEKDVATPVDDYSWLLLLSVFVLAAIALLFFKKSNRKPSPKEGPKPVRPDRHMNDILSALDENERKIIELLMEKGGESLQNKMTRELGFPKSSMSRAVGGLEARGLIETEKLGRIKRVKLSQWFLNGKKP
jgi:hypothetical protein